MVNELLTTRPVPAPPMHVDTEQLLDSFENLIPLRIFHVHWSETFPHKT